MVRLKLSHTNIVFTLLIDEDDDQKCTCGRGIKDMYLEVIFELTTLGHIDSEPILTRESGSDDIPNYVNHPYTQLTCECGIILKRNDDYDLRWVSDDTGIITLR